MSRQCQRVALWAPAKVNLTLRVLGRRPDGYHEIESLIVPISLCDRVEITLVQKRTTRSRVSCTVSGPERVPGGQANLAAVAARAVLGETGARAWVRVHLYKDVPAGSGLGGGSSDAAAVLKALPLLLAAPVSRRRLAGLARRIGADVPFFLACRPAVARGIGERLQNVTDFPGWHLVVVVPPARVGTAWAYRNALPASLTSAGKDISVQDWLERGKFLPSMLWNDFEAGVQAAVPDVTRVAGRLKKLGAEAASMSGTGSAVVGLFPCPETARAAAASFAAPDKAYVVNVLRRRPACRV